MDLIEQNPVLHGPIEVGLRILFILDAVSPNSLTEEMLGIFDYYLINSEDYPNGPKSIHPKIPGREGQLTIKPIILKNAIIVMLSKELISVDYLDSGIQYKANKITEAFLNKLDSPYSNKLRNHCVWLRNVVAPQPIDYLRQLVSAEVSQFRNEEFSSRIK